MNRCLLLLLFLSGSIVSPRFVFSQELVQPPLAPSPSVFEGSAGVFDFVAADQGSLQIARVIGRKVVEVCDELLTPPLERIPKIAVKLAPEGRGNLEGESYLLYQDIAGDYGIAVNWTPELSISVFTKALVETYLKQIVFTVSDRRRAEEVPPWLIAGADLRVQVALRPSLIEYLRELGRDSPMVSLEEFTTKKEFSDLTTADRIASFWFIELLIRSLPTDKELRNVFDSVVEGETAVDSLQKQAESRGGFSGGIEAWWVIGFQDLVHRETGIVLPIERTGKQLFLLNRFELIEDGQPIFTDASGLWDYRDNPLIRQSATGRLAEIDAVLPRVNPIFYNAFRSLGLQFQALLDGDRDDYELHSEEFASEARIAAAMARDVRILAEDPNADLPEPEFIIPEATGILGAQEGE
ncbi:MAG: hypothetical protein AAGJ81_06310 [Verrucomicrobiota bacterium]